MKPTNKSPEIDKLLSHLLGDRSTRPEAITANLCVPHPIGCGLPIEPFHDRISEREYAISGLCQACQDKIWGNSTDE